MPKKSKKLPPEVIDHWPEVFEDVELNVVPLEYLHSIRVTFNDNRVWDIDLKNPKYDNFAEVEKSLDDLFREYEEAIVNVDFRLDTAKVKHDIQKRTKRFLKLRR